MRIPSFVVALVVLYHGDLFITADYQHSAFCVSRHLSPASHRFLGHVSTRQVGAFGG
jgi:hypothetical protein